MDGNHENDEHTTGGDGARDEHLLKLMPHPLLKKSLEVRHMCHYLFYVAPDQVWISDGSNLILADPSGAISYHPRDIPVLQQSYQVHTVAGDGTLFYISKDFRINKLSKDQQEGIPLITLEETWEPMSVLCSPSTGDLLVGTHKSHADKRKSKGKITRYNSNGQQVQTIQHDNNGKLLYKYPGYLSENRNGDIIVSDWHCVVVTNREGGHRFTYTGHSGPPISPRGNCTDTLSNILVCDIKTNVSTYARQRWPLFVVVYTEGWKEHGRTAHLVL
ncbi:uncharacterized protein LOC134281403 [Saccostrea cucullata]|uniref:uncharacterized protein LOC134281403 n=1 Tax=Saccostrea cuccullata TaxID=36930 RepID=UPI002ED1290F